jgi:uncharacterized protein GlcG (DUF336 family)
MRARILSLMSALLLSGLAAEVLAQAQVPSPQTPPAQRISADLITRADALKIADASIAACERQGEKTAAMVTDADGFLRAALSSDGLNPIGLHTANLKTVTVLKFKVSTRSLAERLKSDAAFAAEYGKDTNYFYHPGGLAIYRDGKFVAVLAVGGGHDKDESCALEALKLLPWAKTNP